MMDCLKWYLDPPSPYQHIKRKKNVVKVAPPLTNFLDPHMYDISCLFLAFAKTTFQTMPITESMLVSGELLVMV